MPDLSGEAFLSEDVCRFYLHRPPYAAQALECLVKHAPSKNRLLDLGCGEGKISRPMTKHFKQVVAVDPSVHMIDLGKSLENGRARNIDWLEAKAENAKFDGFFDLVTFGSSIHWMEPKKLFTKLSRHLSAHSLLAFVSGDDAFEPAWARDWRAFLEKWVPIASELPFGSDEWSTIRNRHLDFLDLGDRLDFISDPFYQTVEDFVFCQHSRNTFAQEKLGDRISEFRHELAELLEPYANDCGILAFHVKTQVQFAKLTEAAPES